MSLLCLCVSCLSLVLCVPMSAWPHARLVKSVPASRAVLSQAPAQVQLWFSERLEARFCQLSLWNAAGQRVEIEAIQVDPADLKKLSVGLPALTTGTYTVRYRVLSVDGHIVENQFTFTVRESP